MPTQEILPFGECILDPDEVVLSEDGSKATTFTFPAPVYVEGGGEFAIVLLSASNEYFVFISRMGEEDITTLVIDVRGRDFKGGHLDDRKKTCSNQSGQ